MSKAAKEFIHSIKVRFGQVDPAGIVFHPRYIEMVNDTIEDWFAHLGFPFSAMHLEKHFGVPLVHIEADFFRPSRLGETLDFRLRVIKVGRSSLVLAVRGECRGEKRLAAKVILARVDLKKGASAGWTPVLKRALEAWR